MAAHHNQIILETALRYIHQHITENKYPPSVREITHAVGLSSSSTGQKIVQQLQRNGWINYTNTKARTMHITPEGIQQAKKKPR